ncbi:MAG: ribonuclease HIII [Bacilli bacterium]|nr:ribonuclease HIII [Bacilli bacterium]
MKKPQTQVITLKVSENTKEKMKEYFEDKKRIKTPPYAVFQADEADTVVTLYESGKAVFQGISADIDANMWSEMERHLNPNKKVEMKKAGQNEKKESIKKNSKIYYANTIGSDETGTGDYFGPIVVTAAYVTKENISFLEQLGVRDSKKMTDEHILKIVPLIQKKIPYSSIIFKNEDYNKKHGEDMNMNKIKAILHNKVLLELTEKYKEYEYVVIDQFAESYSYYRYIKGAPKIQKNITFITHAEDQCLSVACGAIISRYILIKEFEKLSKELGVIIPKGAGEKVDEAGAKIVKKYGPEILKKIAKYSFKNSEKIKDLAKS